MLKNLREPVTSAVGFTIIVITLMGVYRDQIDWQWDGVIGLCVGALFFMMPDKILDLILSTLSSVKDKFLSKDKE